MNLKQRTIRTTAALAIGAAALLTVAACQSAGGQAVAASLASPASVQVSAGAEVPVSQPVVSGAPASVAAEPSQGVPTTTSSSHTTSTTSPSTATSRAGSDGGSGSGSGSGSGAGSGGGSHTKSVPSSPDPRFVSASAGCVLNHDDGDYHLIVSWELANATGMALSVDNPGLVGSYGTYSWHGSQDLSELGCYADDRVQDIELYSTGGNGNQAKKTFHVHEDHNRISPPPFANHTDDPSTRTTTSTPPTTETTVTTASQ